MNRKTRPRDLIIHRAAFCIVFMLSCLLADFAQSQQKTSYTIATIERKPFAFKEEGEWTGFSIDLWKETAKIMAVKSDFVEAENFTELLELVKWSDADLAAANISVTLSREQSLDFSQSIFDAGMLIMMPIKREANVFAAIFTPSLFLWLGGAAVLLVIAANLIWLSERRHTDEFKTGYLQGVVNGLWWAVNVVTQAGFDIASPMTRTGRLLAFGLIVVGLFVVGAFVAQITASLTVGQIVNRVEGLQDLHGKRVGTTAGSSIADYLTTNSVRFEGYPSTTMLFEALREGELDAVVHDAPILAYYVAHEGRGQYETVGRIFNHEKYAFALPSGAPRREEIDRALLLLQENGTYDTLITKWFGEDYR